MSLDDLILEDSQTDHSDLAAFIQRLTDLSKQADKADEEAVRLEEQAVLLRKKSEMIRTEHMPSLMDQIHTENLKTPDGWELTVKEILKSSIPESNRGAAISWFREKGHGSLIKNEVAVRLGKGEDQKAAEIKEFFGNLGIVFEMKESVHPQTLNAFVREQRSKGVNIPSDVVSVFVRREVKIKKPKN